MANRYNKHDDGGLAALLKSYEKMRKGEQFTFIEVDGFEQIADYFIENEQFKEALEAAETGLELYPFSSRLLVLKAEALLSIKRYRESLYFLEKAACMDNTDHMVFVLQIEAYLALGETDEAIRVFQQAVMNFEDEDLIQLLFEVAEVFDDFEMFDKVFDCLKLILEQDPHNEEALYKICFWTDYTGRNEEGIALHKNIIEENPYSELAWFNLGAAYQGIKLYEKAIDAYSYAVAINEKFDYAYRNMGDAFIRLKQYKEAIESLEKVLSLSMPEAVIYEAIGHCHDRLKNYSQARSNYKKSSHLNPEDSQLLFKIAGTYMSEENWELAIKTLQSALSFHLLQPEYNLAIGRCYMALENYEEAITYLSNVVRVRPKTSKGWIELLNCLFHAELYDDGYDYAMTAYEQTDAKAIFIYYQAAFLFATNKPKEALQRLEVALHHSPRLLKHFIALDPSFLQHHSIVALISRCKKSTRK